MKSLRNFRRALCIAVQIPNGRLLEQAWMVGAIGDPRDNGADDYSAVLFSHGGELMIDNAHKRFLLETP